VLGNYSVVDHKPTIDSWSLRLFLDSWTLRRLGL
jgi:hypothetical protein